MELNLIEHIPSTEGLGENWYATGPLRARVAAMGESAQAAAFAEWSRRGLPAARDDAGCDVHLPFDHHLDICEILRVHEETASEAIRKAMIARVELFLSADERPIVNAMAGAHGTHLGDLMMSGGQVVALTKVVDVILEARPPEQEVVLPEVPLADEPGIVVNRPVTDADDLASVPPSGKVTDVKAWVGADPVRARAALDVELADKNRSSLVGWLSKIASDYAPSEVVPSSDETPPSPTTADIDVSVIFDRLDAIEEAAAEIRRTISTMRDTIINPTQEV